MKFKKRFIRLLINMSLTLTLSGNDSNLTAEYFPPIVLKSNYVCGLIDFQSYNSIPNVDDLNNLLHIGENVISFPIGSYEIGDINNFIQKKLIDINKKRKNLVRKSEIKLVANNNTLKCEILSSDVIDFSKPNSIGSLLGFSKKKLESNILHESDLYVDINKVNAIRVECNIIDGTYINNQSAHILHEFSIKVSPGYKIIEVPSNVIYLPVNVRRITSLSLKFIDQDGRIINFRGEKITVRLHLKPE